MFRGGNDHDISVVWAGLSTINREANQPLQSRLCQTKRHSAGAIQLWHGLLTVYVVPMIREVESAAVRTPN